jgi:hypothetical protein
MDNLIYDYVILVSSLEGVHYLTFISDQNRQQQVSFAPVERFEC